MAPLARALAELLVEPLAEPLEALELLQSLAVRRLYASRAPRRRGQRLQPFRLRVQLTHIIHDKFIASLACIKRSKSKYFKEN